MIYRAHAPRLLRYLRSQEPASADDLAAETWLAVAERLNGFTGDERAFRAWLFTIAHHRMTDHRRRGARRGTSPQPPEYFEADPDRRGAPLEDAGSQLEEHDAIERAMALLLDVLPHDQAQVIALRVLGGLSVADVSQILGKRPGTVRVAQHRALRKLATTLTSDQLRQSLGS